MRRMQSTEPVVQLFSTESMSAASVDSLHLRILLIYFLLLCFCFIMKVLVASEHFSSSMNMSTLEHLLHFTVSDNFDAVVEGETL